MNAIDTQVEDYAARVRAALADVPAGTRDELLADLPDHLAEIAGEEDGDLTSRLGPPEAYAADLRTAAGLPPARASVRGRARDWGDHPWVRATGDFLPELRPGWWVVRGMLLAAVPVLWLGFGAAVWVLLAVPAVVGSVVVGRRAAHRDRWRFAGWALSLGAVLVAAGLLLVTDRLSTGQPEAPAYDSGVGPADGGFSNLYVYGPDGKPLTDVQIVDQDGRPVVPPVTTDGQGNPITAVPRYDAQGRVVPNVYPQEQTVSTYDLDAQAPSVRRVTPPPAAPTPLAPR